MDIIPKEILNYCEAHTTPESKVLYDLQRETHLKTLAPQMISGHLQGQLLYFVSKMVQPVRSLEIGTFTGYAAICLARGLREGGILHTIEANPELESIIRKYIRKAGLENKIRLHIGMAQEVIPALDETFDLVFIDAGKEEYEAYFNVALDKVRAGGILLADNVLWSGKVLSEEHDRDTGLIHRFNQMVQNDPRVENLMLPLRDGITVIRKL